MRIYLLLCLTAVASISSAANVTDHVAPGNLEVTKKLSCKDLDSIQSNHTPVNLFTGVKSCLAQKNYESAARGYIMAQLFGRFDTLRVTDATAHQAPGVAWMEISSQLDEKQLLTLSEAVKQMRMDPEFEKFARALPPPSYHPTYMIQHGMGAFINNGKPAIVENFDPVATWTGILDELFAKE